MPVIILHIMNQIYKSRAFSVEQNGDDLILKNKYGTYSKKELKQQLFEGRFTVEELGKIYDLKEYQFVHILRSLGITDRNDLNDIRIADCTITPSLHQVLIGTLLGDAFMRTPKCYQLGHGVDQVDYCYHIANRLHQFIASFGDKDVSSKTKKSFAFWTYRHDLFIPYYKRFYSFSPHKKFITVNTAPDLEAEGLSYWFMDDGKYSEYGAHLCVGNITTQEGNILRDLLFSKFGLKSNLQIYDSAHNYYTIYIKAESRDLFFSLINPYVIPSMRYKIKGEIFPRQGFVRDIVFNKHLELCKTANRFIRYFGDENLVNKINEINSLFKSAKDSYAEKIRTAIGTTQISKTSVRKLPTEEELTKLLSQGYTDNSIAKMHGVSRNKIGELRRSLKIDRLSSRLTDAQKEKLEELLKQNVTATKLMPELKISFYKAKKIIKGSQNKCHQKIMKEKCLKQDLKKIEFNPVEFGINDYEFQKEDISGEIVNFLKSYEWLKSIGVYPKWCFSMRLKGYLAGIQILNEPTSYSKILGDETMKYECLIQRGCTISWAHEHLGSRMLMKSIDWMIKNSDKRLFIGYADPKAGEVGIIYQACNFLYLGNKFGVTEKYINPNYRNGKEFCAHSLKRTSVFKWWCRQNGIQIEPSWMKSNGFKNLKVIPIEIKNRWYDWGRQIIKESTFIPMSQKGKYILIRGKDRRENKYLMSLFKEKIYPYPKREI
jgi:hypothetical protein